MAQDNGIRVIKQVALSFLRLRVLTWRATSSCLIRLQTPSHFIFSHTSFQGSLDFAGNRIALHLPVASEKEKEEGPPVPSSDGWVERPVTPPLQLSRPLLDFTPPKEDEETIGKGAEAEVKGKKKRAGAKGDAGPAKKKSKKKKAKKEEDEEEDEDEEDKENVPPE
ncbi:hypothetical protein DE146DRAFT_757423 [Phaeosphaeria sp. MPI-PUGE-AT-0046c]|nr:hypothetical protein DE146DRAFT_757423 [Phaeosphaeria sp. MPI-PUGE-AT-0046c]